MIISSKVFNLDNKKTFIFSLYILSISVFALIYWYFGTPEHMKFDNDKQNLSAIDAVYFSIVTQTTTGHGDVTPKSNVMRITNIIQLLCVVYLIIMLAGG